MKWLDEQVLANSETKSPASTGTEKCMEKAKKCIFVQTKDGKPYRWIVRFSVHGLKKYVGCYKSAEEATEAAIRALTKQGLDPSNYIRK